ncbi:hypothetical protein D3C83_234690 [compost metagenome]
MPVNDASAARKQLERSGVTGRPFPIVFSHESQIPGEDLDDDLVAYRSEKEIAVAR